MFEMYEKCMLTFISNWQTFFNVVVPFCTFIRHCTRSGIKVAKTSKTVLLGLPAQCGEQVRNKKTHEQT